MPNTVESPMPRCLPLVLKKGSKMRYWVAGSMPAPVSETVR
jgi:hypothetical protein